MARKKIDNRTAEQFASLHRRGESYQSIARKFNVDYRTVKSCIQRVNEDKDREHWEVVSRQVDAKYLDEHYRMLLKIATSLTEVASSDPIVTSHTLATSDFFNILLTSAIQKAAKLLVDRGIDLNDEGQIERHQADRLSRKLIEALMEHEPQLEKALEAWKREWERFQKLRGDLMDTAENLFKNDNVSDTVARKIKTGIVEEALQNKLLGELPRSSLVDASEKENTSITNKLIRDRVRLVRCNDRQKMTVYIGSREEVEAARAVYDKVLSQLCHENLIHPVQVSYNLLMKHGKDIENHIDRLILVGRPQGECSLCLNQPMNLSSSREKHTQRRNE